MKYIDTPVKTEINKPYIDNIDTYNRDRALITKSLSDRLDLGQNSLLRAQQVRVAAKHTDQVREFPEHPRQISLGEEIENTSYDIIDRNRSFIPQVDGIIDSKVSLDKTPDSIDLTESPLKHTNRLRHIEKINEDTSDNDTDEKIIFDNDKVKKTYKISIKALRKRAKTEKTKKSRTAKMYAMNIERKKLLKQRREKAIQNAKDRKMTKGNFLTVLQASCKAYRASKDTQSSTLLNDEFIKGVNADTITQVDNIENIEIVARNVGDAATTAENINTDSANRDNIDNAESEKEKKEEVVMSNDNIDNAAVSDNNTGDATSGYDNAENVTKGETSTNDVPSPLLYDRKTTDPSKVKTSKKHRPIRIKPLESSTDDPVVDENNTKPAKGHTEKGHAFDPTDM